MQVISLSRRLVASIGVGLVSTFFGAIVLQIPSTAANETPVAKPTTLMVPSRRPSTMPVTVTVRETVVRTKTVKVHEPKIKPNLVPEVPVMTVTMPGTVKTVTQNVALPANTVTVRTSSVVTAAGQTRTVRDTLTQRAVVTQTGPTQTITKTATHQPVTTTKTTEIFIYGPERVVTVPEAFSLSAVAVCGIVGFLVILFLLAFALGWLRGDNGNRKFIREVRDELKYN